MLCLFPPKKENFKEWTYILVNHQIWAYRLFSVNVLTKYISTKHTGKSCASQFPTAKKHVSIVQLLLCVRIKSL